MENQSFTTYASHEPPVLTPARKFKILIVTSYFYPKIGGVENYVFNIAKRLNKDERYEVVVVTSGDGISEVQTGIVEGMKVYRLPVQWKVSNTPISLKWYRQIKRIISTEKPDIVNAHSPVPFMADLAALAVGDTPLILTYHSGSMLKKRWPWDAVVYLYEFIFLPRIFKKADIIISSSEKFIPKWRKILLNKLRFVQPGVDTSFYFPSQESKNEKIITYVGRVEHNSGWKGIEVLLKAMTHVVERFPEARLEIIGGGDAVGYYGIRARELNIDKNVKMIGPLSGQDLLDAYQRSTVVVLPSTTDSESFGMVLIEAMSTGCPVIGSNVGGIPNVIDHGENGFLFTPNDPVALSDAIGEVLSNDALALRLGLSGALKAKKFDWDLQADKYKAIIEGLMAKDITVAQVVGYYPPHIGGMEVVARDISSELSQNGYKIIVFTSDIGAPEGAGNETAGNYHVRRLKSFEFAHTPFIWSLFFRLLPLPKNSILHVHVAHAGIPEVVLMAAKLRGFPVVAHFHLDVGQSGPLGFLLPVYKKFVLGPVLRHVDKVIVFTPEQGRLIGMKYGVKASEVAVIPNGVAETYFYRETRPVPEGLLRILTVGRLASQKRVDRLIDALPLLKIPCQLTIVGDGEERGKYESQARNLGLKNVIFAGKKSGDELLDYYRQSDVFAISSDVEGMPLAVLEAMASGLPILASDVIGLHELVGGVGVLVKDPSPENFAREIAKLWNERVKLQEMSRKSVEKADELSLRNITEKIMDVYKEIGG